MAGIDPWIGHDPAASVLAGVARSKRAAGLKLPDLTGDGQTRPPQRPGPRREAHLPPGRRGGVSRVSRCSVWETVVSPAQETMAFPAEETGRRSSYARDSHIVRFPSD